MLHPSQFRRDVKVYIPIYRVKGVNDRACSSPPSPTRRLFSEDPCCVRPLPPDGCDTAGYVRHNEPDARAWAERLRREEHQLGGLVDDGVLGNCTGVNEDLN